MVTPTANRVWLLAEPFVHPYLLLFHENLSNPLHWVKSHIRKGHYERMVYIETQWDNPTFVFIYYFHPPGCPLVFCKCTHCKPKLGDIKKTYAR